MAAEPNSTEVELQQRDPQPMVSIRAIIPVAGLGEAVGDRIGALGEYLRHHNIAPAGPPFVRYHTFGEIETDMELGVPVPAPIAGEGRIVAGTLAGGPACASWHVGPHERLGEAYARIAHWLQAHNREADGPPLEIYYWLDLNSAPAPDNIPTAGRTQLVQPIK
jgi:effector-binding domain-containing protein